MSQALRIVRVSLEGVKAFDRDLTLSPLNLLVGPPGSGKSSVSDALRFAALGWIPALGGREADTARILRGPRIVVRVELSDGRWFTRSLSRSGASFRTEARTSWLPPGATNTAHAGAIRELFGQSDEEAAEHLDLRELLDASPAARAAKIDALLAATSAKPEDVAARVAAFAVARLGALDENRIPADPKARAAMVAGLLPTLDAGQAALVPTVEAAVLGVLRSRGIAGAIEHANGEKRTAAEAVKRKTSARAELEDRDLAATAPAATLAELNARRQAASDRLAVVRADRERLGGAAAKKREAQVTLDAARERTEDHEAVRANVASFRADADRWAGELAAIVDPAPLPPLALVPADPSAERRAAQANALGAKLEAEAAEIEAEAAPIPAAFEPTRSTDGAEERLRQRRSALEVARRDPWTEVRKIADDLEAEEAGFAKPIARLRELAAHHGWDVPAAQAALDEAERELSEQAKAQADVDARNAAIHKANQAAAAAYAERRKQARELRAEAARNREAARQIRGAAASRTASDNHEASEAYRLAAEKRQATIDANAKARADLERRIRQARESADADERAVAEEAAAVEKAQAYLDGLGEVAPFDVGGADAEIAELSAELSKIDADKREVEGADARKRELASLVAAIAEADAARRVWTETEWALLRVREADLSERSEPILARMRKFLEAAKRTEVPYLRATKTATDFGWRRAGQELSIEALSGGETVIFATALAAAVIALRRPPIRCLLVEAAELGEDRYTDQVLAGLYAVRDDVDLAVVSTAADVKGPNGWHVFSFNGAGRVAETDRS